MSTVWKLKFALVVSVCSACAGSTTKAVTPDEGALAGELVDAKGEAAPSWVTAPGTYRTDPEGVKVVCGEGSMGGTANLGMAQTASTGRARTNLARSMNLRVKGLLKDYQANTVGGGQFGAESAGDEQHIEDASKQITDQSLNGTEVYETWISSKGTMHSLVCLNVERFKGAVGQMQGLREEVRVAVVERAEAAFDELGEVEATSGSSR